MSYTPLSAVILHKAFFAFLISFDAVHIECFLCDFRCKCQVMLYKEQENPHKEEAGVED